jgi:hypothetical protein
MLDLHVTDYPEGSYIRRGGARYNLIASGAEVSAALCCAVLRWRCGELRGIFGCKMFVS